MTTASTVICVLGMHRSGTSCLTGLLEDAGVYLGNVSKKNPYNLKGNQENLAIMRLHDEVLASNGGSWDRPPEDKVNWSSQQKARLQAIVDEYRDQPLWAFKDPRSLFTLDAWRETLPGMKFIGTFRHPSVVAQSLHRRGKISPEEGFQLWFKYNHRLLDYQRTIGFNVLCFDMSPMEYLAAAVRAFQQLGLHADQASLHFYDEGLRSNAIDPMFATVPPAVLAVYEQLRAIST